MTDPAADAARSAAVILAPDLGPNLPAEVEAALAARGTQQRRDRYMDPVSLASLIVSIATLAWTIYNDQRSHTPDPPPGLRRPPGAHHPPRPGHAPASPAPSASPKWLPLRLLACPTLPGSQAHRPRALAGRPAGPDKAHAGQR
jgi:hypothetical protein